MSPLALEPQFSQFGSEQLRLRLLEWQAEQDLHKRKTTKDRLHQKNIQLKEQLDIVYEEEQQYERHHLQELEQLKSPHSFSKVLIHLHHHHQCLQFPKHQLQFLNPLSQVVCKQLVRSLCLSFHCSLIQSSSSSTTSILWHIVHGLHGISSTHPIL